MMKAGIVVALATVGALGFAPAAFAMEPTQSAAFGVQPMKHKKDDDNDNKTNIASGNTFSFNLQNFSCNTNIGNNAHIGSVGNSSKNTYNQKNSCNPKNKTG